MIQIKISFKISQSGGDILNDDFDDHILNQKRSRLDMIPIFSLILEKSLKFRKILPNFFIMQIFGLFLRTFGEHLGEHLNDLREQDDKESPEKRKLYGKGHF